MLYSECFAWIAWSTWFALLCFDWLVCNALGSFGCTGSLGADRNTVLNLHASLFTFVWLELPAFRTCFVCVAWEVGLALLSSILMGGPEGPHQNLRRESFDLRALVCVANLRDLLKNDGPPQKLREDLTSLLGLLGCSRASAPCFVSFWLITI